MSSRLQGSATESDSSSIQTKMVRVEGFEPPTASSQTRSANQTALHTEKNPQDTCYLTNIRGPC